jgi:hypothetical protein
MNDMTTHQVVQFTTVSLAVLYWHRRNPSAFIIQPKCSKTGAVKKSNVIERVKIILRAVAALTPASCGV